MAARAGCRAGRPTRSPFRRPRSSPAPRSWSGSPARSACSPCRPTCSPYRRWRRRRCSACWPRCWRRSRCTLAQGAAWLAYLPVKWLVLIAHTGAEQPGAGASLPRGLDRVVARAAADRPRRARPAAPSGCAGCSGRTRRGAGGRCWLSSSSARPGRRRAGCWPAATSDRATRSPSGSPLRRLWSSTSAPTRSGSTAACAAWASRRVPLLVLTHLHADHVEGVPGLLRGRQVAQVQIGPLDEPAVEKARLLGWLGERRHPCGAGRDRRGARRRARSVGRCSTRPPGAAPSSDPNNSSIVLRLVTHGVTVLFAGDLEGEAQRSLLARGAPLTRRHPEGPAPRQPQAGPRLPRRRPGEGRADAGRCRQPVRPSLAGHAAAARGRGSPGLPQRPGRRRRHRAARRAHHQRGPRRRWCPAPRSPSPAACRGLVRREPCTRRFQAVADHQ